MDAMSEHHLGNLAHLARAHDTGCEIPVLRQIRRLQHLDILNAVDRNAQSEAARRRIGDVHSIDDQNAVLLAQANNPRGTRIFGPVARELRERNFMKIISLAPEVL